MTVHFQRRYSDCLNIRAIRRIDALTKRKMKEMSVGVVHVGRLFNYLVIPVHTFITAILT